MHQVRHHCGRGAHACGEFLPTQAQCEQLQRLEYLLVGHALHALHEVGVDLEVLPDGGIDLVPLEAIEHVQDKVGRLSAVIVARVPAPQLKPHPVRFAHAGGRRAGAVGEAVWMREQGPARAVVR